jgi:hypothetical protein
MIKFSGSFVGNASSQAIAIVNDVPNHDLSLVQISGPQIVSDPLWNGAIVAYSGMADLVAGSGTQTGYFVNRLPNGETNYGTFAAKITTASDAVTLEGTWKFSGGTGKFAGITGNGTYTGVMMSPTQVKTTWEGTYQLA